MFDSRLRVHGRQRFGMELRIGFTKSGRNHLETFTDRLLIDHCKLSTGFQERKFFLEVACIPLLFRPHLAYIADDPVTGFVIHVNIASV